MRRLSFLILFSLPFGAAGHLVAQEALTEEAFLAAVDENHPASRALAGELGLAEAERRQAGLLADPRVEVTREDPDEAARETTLGVAWAPPIDGRRRWAIRAADAGLEAERRLLESRLAQQRLEVRAAYAGWAGNQSRLALRMSHADRLESLAKRTRARAESGEVSELQARRLEIAFETARAGLARTRADAAGSRARAAAWVAESAAGAPDLSAPPALPRLPKAPADSSPEPGWALRPDLQAARARVEQAEAQRRLSKRVLEAPELLLGWKEIEDQGGDFDGPVFAIDWKVPVFDRRRADRMAAESALEAAVATEEWTKRRAQSEFVAAVAGYVEFREAALAAQATLETAEGMGRAAAAAFELGESGVTDLLDTLQSILEARLAALGLYLSALEAHRQLEFAAGRPLTSGDAS
jgi:cobalt-zinc-cadmium efflux system outer membrane protein